MGCPEEKIGIHPILWLQITPLLNFIGVTGLVENPHENETVVQINKILLQEQTVLMRVVGQMDRIGGDKLPKRWTVFLKKGVQVDFVGQQIEENDSQ